jgi:hypothetical protein
VPFSWGRGTRTPSRELLQCSYGALPDTKMERKSSFELNICNMRVAFLGLLCKVDCYCQLLRRKEELQQKKKKLIPRRTTRGGIQRALLLGIKILFSIYGI